LVVAEVKNLGFDLSHLGQHVFNCGPLALATSRQPDPQARAPRQPGRLSS
jgi:hypothetical protein